MYQLRPYQSEACAAAMNEFTKTKPEPFVIQAATGAGKSLIIAELCHRLDTHVLILQPSKEILEQNYQKLISYDPMIDAGIYSASKGRREIAKFTFATIGSIYKQPELFQHFKYVIIDECHGVNPKNLSGMLTTFLKAIGCSRVCGLTATPYRIDTIWEREGNMLRSTASLKMINRITRTPFFKKIVYKIETADLIEQGFLAPIMYYHDNVELDDLVVNSTGADFTTASLEKFWNEKRLSRIAKAAMYSHEHNKLTLIFCSSIRQAMAAQKLIEGSRIACEVVTGSTPILEREAAIQRFKTRQTRILLNVGVFTTGFDVPELDCIVMARPTMSLALYYQIVGRGVRIDPNAPDKVLKFYDLVGVVERLGRVETIRVKTERGGYRDEVWSEVGRMDGTPLYSFLVEPKEKNMP